MSKKFLDNTGVSDLVNSIATKVANKYATKSNTLTTKSVVIDPDTTTEVGIYQWFYPTTITTNPIAYGTLIVSAIDGYYIQIAIYANEPFIFIRNKVYDTSWTDWKCIGFQTSNQNLLINPDFMINQRNQSSYTPEGSNRIYTVDRWAIFGGVVTPQDNGIKIELGTGSSYYGFYQPLELKNVIGNTFTLSAKINSKLYSGTVTVLDNNTEYTFFKLKSNSIERFIISSGSSSTYIQLYGTSSYIIEWVKLEIGSVSTSFVPPDPTIELLKCKRYFEIKTQGVYGLSPNDVWISGFMFDSPKRVIPSIKLTSSLGTQNTLSTYTGADSNITLTGMPNVRIDRIEGSPCNQNIGTSLYSYTCIADAEIY